MDKNNLGLFKKWWVRTIRERNYFGFRYWWFNWLLLLTCILLFVWGTNTLNSKESKVCKTDFSGKMDSIYRDLSLCCACRADSILPPPPKDTIVPPPPKDTLKVDCPDRVLVFQVCNSNAMKDDNFEIYLNNVYLGKLELGVSDKVGSVFIASTNKSLKITKADFDCPLRNMKTFYFNPSAVKYGKNKLFMKNIRNNGNNNLGSVQIRNYLIVGNELKNPCRVKDIKYEMSSGENYSAIFNYTRCCE